MMQAEEPQTTETARRSPPAPSARTRSLPSRMLNQAIFQVLVVLLLATCCIGPLIIIGRTRLPTAGTASADTPRQVPGLQGVTAVATGAAHSLALREDGTVWAWGSNAYGQLGLGNTRDQRTPQQVPLAGRATAIAAGQAMSYAVSEGGEVWAWGDNLLGYLGTRSVEITCARTRGTTTKGGFSTNPVRVEVLSGVTALAANYRYALALTASGEVWAWGGNDRGQAGESGESCQEGGRTFFFVPIPTRIGLPVRATAIATGGAHGLALAEDGVVWSWGANEFGQLGSGTIGSVRSTPAPVNGLTGVTAIAAGSMSSVAVAHEPGKSGIVWLWGGGYGNVTCQYAPDSPERMNWPCSTAPVKLEGLPSTTLLAARTVAVEKLSGGRYWDTGQTGSPAPVFSGHSYLDAAFLAVATDRNLWSWDTGRTAGVSGTFTARPFGLDRVRVIATGHGHYLVVKDDGTVWAWGLNHSGQLGH